MLKVESLASNENFSVLNIGKDGAETEIKSIYCCDLLSIAMSKMPESAVWVTVMSNLNTLAVASLTDTACVVLAEGVSVDSNVMTKAAEQGITVLSTKLPIYEATQVIRGLMN